VWGITAPIDTHTLETHIYRLRSKLATLAQPFPDIITIDGAYRLAYHTVTS
jgi:DNA-binding response OmpR family regulator